MVRQLLGQRQSRLLTEGPVCAARLALAQGTRDSQVFSCCRTAEAILTLGTLECPGTGVAGTLDSSPSYPQPNGNKGRHQR